MELFQFNMKAKFPSRPGEMFHFVASYTETVFRVAQLASASRFRMSLSSVGDSSAHTARHSHLITGK